MRDLRHTLLDALEAGLARRAARGLDGIARAAGRPIEWSE